LSSKLDSKSMESAIGLIMAKFKHGKIVGLRSRTAVVDRGWLDM
jgi:hypothetical protein